MHLNNFSIYFSDLKALMASNMSFKLDNNQQILTNFSVNPFNYSVNDSQSLLFLKLKLNSSLHQMGSQSSEPLIHTYVVCANRSLLEFSALQQLSLQVSDNYVGVLILLLLSNKIQIEIFIFIQF
jgi:hypothetical protein